MLKDCKGKRQSVSFERRKFTELFDPVRVSLIIEKNDISDCIVTYINIEWNMCLKRG